MSNSLHPMDYSPPGFSIHGILQGRILEWVAVSFSRESSDPGIEPRSPALGVDALTSESPEKPLKISSRELDIPGAYVFSFV